MCVAEHDKCWVVLLEVARTTHTARQAGRQQVGAVLQCLCLRLASPWWRGGQTAALRRTRWGRENGTADLLLGAAASALGPLPSGLSIAAALLEPISQTCLAGLRARGRRTTSIAVHCLFAKAGHSANPAFGQQPDGGGLVAGQVSGLRKPGGLTAVLLKTKTEAPTSHDRSRQRCTAPTSR